MLAVGFEFIISGIEDQRPVHSFIVRPNFLKKNRLARVEFQKNLEVRSCIRHTKVLKYLNILPIFVSIILNSIAFSNMLYYNIRLIVISGFQFQE